ncbi:MAG: hypothetical protein IKO84_01010 [Butyrivibrio sp.]|nr:hypothetical protein [Butyrivibrio sp.]
MRHNLIKILMAPVGFMLAFACVAGATVYGNMQQVTTETVECKIESNDSSLTYSGDSGEIGFTTNFESFDDCKNYLQENTIGSGYDFREIWLAKYDRKVLVAFPRDGQGKYAHFYTQNPGEYVILAGSLESDRVLKIKDGVIIACNDGSYETYLLAPGGRELVHKDYVDDTYWGFTNDTNIESKKVKFTGGEEEYLKLWENYYKAYDIR